MQRAKGSVLISIGSILMIISGIMGILLGLLLAFASGWLVSTFTALSDGLVEESAVGLAGILAWGGAFVGILVIALSVLGLVFGIMCYKRRHDLQRSTFPLVIGIIFTVLALLSFIQDINVASVFGLASPLLILIGASLNKGQLKSLGAYPQGQAPYPPYQGPQQAPYPPQAYPPQAGQDQPPYNPPPTP